MPPTAELVGRVGRLTGQHPATEEGLILSVRVLPGRGQGVQRVTACALTADTLGLATQQGEVYAVHLSKQRYVCLDSLQSPCTSAAFMTRLSRRLFVGCADGAVQCYDVSASSRLAQLPGHRTAVACLSTKSDTEQLLSASADAVLLWDMATFKQRRMLGEAPYGSSKAVFSPPGNLLAAATPSGSITLWDSKHLRELGRLQTPLGQQQTRFNSSSISISPDEQWLVVGCKAPALLLWYSLHDRELQYAVQLPADMFGVVQVQVMPDSTSAAGGCARTIDAVCFNLVHTSAQQDDLHDVWLAPPPHI
jgi:WD40 repeat protein